jgi:hypothetical protein
MSKPKANRDPWYVPEPECPECGHSPCLRCDPCIERRREAGIARLKRAVEAYVAKQKTNGVEP